MIWTLFKPQVLEKKQNKGVGSEVFLILFNDPKQQVVPSID